MDGFNLLRNRYAGPCATFGRVLVMGTIALKLLLVALYGWLYMAGGRAGTPGGKFARRWLGSAVIIGGLYGFSWLAGTLSISRGLAIPLFFGTAILGYGGTTVAQKLLRRTLFSLPYALYSLLLGFLYGCLLLGVGQAILCVFASVYMGVLNPDKAAEEETLIGFLSVVSLPFIVS